MEGGSSNSSNEERGAEKAMDDYLKSLGLHRKKIAKDGSCLFRAVAEQVLHCQSLHTKVRARCVEFLRKNRNVYEAFIEGDFEDYLHKLQDPQQWVGEVEINALAVMYKRDFLIFQEPGKPAVNITSNNFTDTVLLCFLNGNHYDSVYPISHLKNAALCQSILYELLYDGVFKVEQSTLDQCQRAGRNDVLSDDNMPLCVSSDESDTDAGEALWVESEAPVAPKQNKGRGRRGMQLPERVRRSLNPTLFRNIEYDIWHKTKRAQQKMDYHIAAGMQFSVGDRCKVCLDGGRVCTATIKQLSPDSGLVTVYSEELGQKEVPLWNLRPPTNEPKSWSTVVGQERRISNGHGDWEGRGRGRGKPVLTPVSHATALGSIGRVMKQQSWPPNAPGDEQGGGGKSRRSMSTVDSSFGLTDKQREAKEKEERTIALVEIQRRDEQSFPALGTSTQGDGGRKKAVDKKRALRTKAKSPVEDIQSLAPSDGQQPRPDSPPPPTPPTDSAASSLVAKKPAAALHAETDSSDAKLNGASAASSPAAAPTTKPSYVLATARPTSPLAAAAATNTKPSAAAAGGAVPPSVPLPASPVSFLTPVLPVTSSPPTSCALSSSSPPPSSSSISSFPARQVQMPPPTFIAPVAPISAQGFLPPNTIQSISAAPVESHSHPPPSPAPNCSSSVSSVRLAAQVHSASSVSTQTPNVKATPAASQTPQIQSKTDSPASLPPSQPLAPVTREDPQPYTAPNQSAMHQMQPETKTFPQNSHPSHTQHQCLSHAEAASLPESQKRQCAHTGQAPVSHPHPQNLSKPHTNLPLDASDHHHHHPSSQSTESFSAAQQLQPSVVYSHPSQVAHPSYSTQLPLHSQIPVRQTHQADTALPPANPQPHPHAPPQQSPQPSHQPPVMPAHPPPALPPYPQPLPGVVPLQQLSQLYQDPLYPGFPQGEKGSVAPIPPFSSSKFGEDLPQDKNVLRFFYNLGVKAYSMPMLPPYIYLLPLQQTHTMQPRELSRSPSPTPAPTPTPQYSSSSHHFQQQEAYPQQQYPPPALASHFEAAQMTLQHGETFHPTRYPVSEPSPQQLPCPSLPWQQQHIPPPNSSSYPASYSSPTPHYPVPQPIPQGYHSSRGPGLPLYPTGVPSYPHTTLGYQPTPARAHEEPQVKLEVLEKGQHCGPADSVQSAMAASLVNTNGRTVVVSGFAAKKDHRESVNRALLLVDPTLNSKPMLVSNSAMKDVPVSMTMVKNNSTPGSPLHHDLISKTPTAVDNSASRGYREHQQLLQPSNTYTSLGAPEPSHVGYPPAVAGPTSVGCDTNEDWEEETQAKHTRLNQRGARRSYRGGGGGRWRGSSDSQRGAHRKRCEGDTGPALTYTHYNSSYRGRGRGY